MPSKQETAAFARTTQPVGRTEENLQNYMQASLSKFKTNQRADNNLQASSGFAWYQKPEHYDQPISREPGHKEQEYATFFEVGGYGKSLAPSIQAQNEQARRAFKAPQIIKTRKRPSSTSMLQRFDGLTASGRPQVVTALSSAGEGLTKEPRRRKIRPITSLQGKKQLP